jgi:hypothetical protein
VGKRQYVSLKIPQKLEIIRRLESGESWSEVMTSYNIGLLTILWYKETEGPISVLHGINWKWEGPSKVTDNETA